MSDQNKQPFEPFFDAVRQIVREELRESLKGDPASGSDRLFTAEQASDLLAVSPDWLYRNSRKLPFSRKLGAKMLRFSGEGIQKYLSSKRAC